MLQLPPTRRHLGPSLKSPAERPGLAVAKRLGHRLHRVHRQQRNGLSPPDLRQQITEPTPLRLQATGQSASAHAQSPRNIGGSRGIGQGRLDGASTVADCEGEYGGTYTGSDSGTVAGTLLSDGELVITFVSSGGGSGVEGVTQISESGDIYGVSQGITVEGSLDFSDCSTAGSWSGYGGGSWSMQRL
jgi:hypothetical protein